MLHIWILVMFLFRHHKKKHKITNKTNFWNDDLNFVLEISFCNIWTFWKIYSRKMNIKRFNCHDFSLKICSFVIKIIAQHMIERVNKSRKMNLGLATLVLPGLITTLMNCFFVSITLLRKSIHTVGLLY